MANPLVLVVEDTISIQKFCRAVLEMDGFDVEAAGSIFEARTKYAQRKPDLALIDIGLPDGDGLELMREWSSDKNGPVPPMLFFTGRDELDTRLACFKAGARDYVVKPCAPEELLARVKVHLAIKRDHDALDQRVHELELVSRARQDMADMIVHDLKAPLSSIKGTLQLIHAHGLISKQSHAALLGQADSAADFMLLMLNDLLDVGAAKSGSLKVEKGPVETAALLEKLRGLFGGRLQAQKVELKTSVDSSARSFVGDHNLVYRILANLISNAVKASKPGAAVEVGCARRGDRVRFTVEDRGKGVPDSMKKEIFVKYTTTGRAANPTETGTGLGLSFCRLASEAMGGRVWVEDRPGGGACFLLELPA